jgi:hypothetical protein
MQEHTLFIETRSLVKISLSFLALLMVCGSPVFAFTAQSLDITIEKNGDATAVFQYALEGVIENAVPQSLLQEELIKGLSTSSEPPTVIAFDRTGATMLLRKFAQVSDTDKGTEYMTASMDFKKAEIALKNSALNYVISADFSPQGSKVTFPDGYFQEFSDISTLPSLTHIVIDPKKTGVNTTYPDTGSIMVNSSPDKARVFIDSRFAGETPGLFSDIAPGQHIITLERDDCEPATRTITVNSNETTQISLVLAYVTPTPLSGRQLPLGLPGFGVVVTGCALAGVALLRKIRQ